MNSDMCLLVTLDFAISGTGLITERILNNTWIIFIGALLGSVFGIIGSVATLMGITESLKYKIKITLFKLSRFSRVREERWRLHSYLQESNARESTNTETALIDISANSQKKFTKVYPETFFDQVLTFS